MLRRGGMGLLALPLVVLAACGAQSQKAGDQRPSISVAEVPVAAGGITAIFNYAGSVSPRWTVAIAPKMQGQLAEVQVRQGQRVAAGQVLAVMDSRTQVDSLAQAKANVSSAQAKLDTMLAGGRAEDVAASQAQAAAAQAGVISGQASLESARQRLNAGQAGGRLEAIAQAQAKLDADQAALSRLVNGPVPLDITNARLAVEQAKDRLWSNQTTYDAQVARGAMTKEQREAALSIDQTGIDQANTALAKLQAAPRPEDVAQLQAAVNADKAALEVAKQPNRPEDLVQLEQAVVAAEAQVAQLQQTSNAQRANATKAARPYTAQDIAQAAASLQVAQALAQTAQSALDDTSIKAPAAGVIADVPAAVGSTVGPGSPVASLIAGELEVTASVDETQVTLFKEGQPASINAAGLGGVPGTVFAVSPSADSRTRKFTVRVSPTVVDSQLRAGMSATVRIETGREANALLVPKEALVLKDGRPAVFVDRNGKARLTPVTTGVSDDTSIQIRSGLEPGMMVILAGSLELADGDNVSPSTVPPAPSGPAPAPAP